MTPTKILDKEIEEVEKEIEAREIITHTQFIEENGKDFCYGCEGLYDEKIYELRAKLQAFKQAQEIFDKKIEEIRKKFFLCGCGEEYLDGIEEDDEWELMCGKHIWKDKETISELHLCSDCIDKLEYFDEEINKIFGDKND